MVASLTANHRLGSLFS